MRIFLRAVEKLVINLVVPLSESLLHVREIENGYSG